MARRFAAEEGLFAGIRIGLNGAAVVDAAAKRDPNNVLITVVFDTNRKYIDCDLFAG